MGALATTCSDVKFAPGLGSAKPLEAESSDEDAEEEEDDDADDDDDDEDMRRDAAEALEEGINALQRGKTVMLKDAIDHSVALGVDNQHIMRAEARLEEHRMARRRSAFAHEVRDFLSEEAAQTLQSCNEMQTKAREMKIDSGLLKTLEERITDLELSKELNDDEKRKAKQFSIVCARRFVSETVRGREIQWLELPSGRKVKANCYLDVTLKNFSIVGHIGGKLASCKFADLTPSYAKDVEEVASSEGFTSMPQSSQDLTVACQVHGQAAPWCWVEQDARRMDETLLGIVVLNKVAFAAAGKAKPFAAPTKEEQQAPASKTEEKCTSKKDKHKGKEGGNEPAKEKDKGSSKVQKTASNASRKKDSEDEDAKEDKELESEEEE